MKKERKVGFSLSCSSHKSPPILKRDFFKNFFSPHMCNSIARFTSIIAKQSNVGAVMKSASRNAELICLKTPQVLVTALKPQGYCVWRILFQPRRGQIPENILGYYVRFKSDLFLKDNLINQLLWYKPWESSGWDWNTKGEDRAEVGKSLIMQRKGIGSDLSLFSTARERRFSFILKKKITIIFLCSNRLPLKRLH